MTYGICSIQLTCELRKCGAKVVLLGDTAQTKAIEAGRAFAMLQEHGMKTVLMGDIQRQRSERLRQAVQLAASGQVSRSLPLLDRVLTIPDQFSVDEHGHKTRDSSARYEAIAQAYVGLPTDQQASTIVVTGTNASRQAINARIHALRGLEGKGQRCQLLSRHDTTRAERSVARYYTVGDIVVPERDYQCGLKRGELYRVTGIPRHDRITVQAVDPAALAPEPIEIIPRTMGKLSVYHLNESELSVGDRVLYNAESFSRTTAQDTYYVSISRERHEVVVFTDDAEKLPERVDRLGVKGLAHDLLPVTNNELTPDRNAPNLAQSPTEAELEIG